uniref:E3 ubiquitin-protein ligase CHFR n=1 Tax=Steinernema glaseri TaxID=37863 RepID=A0A1I7YDG8_9BILA
MSVVEQPSTSTTASQISLEELIINIPPNRRSGVSSSSDESLEGPQPVPYRFVLHDHVSNQTKVVEIPEHVAFISFGRHKKCTISLPRTVVLSMVHCQIVRKVVNGEIQYHLSDHSTNGTYLNGQRVESASPLLRDGATSSRVRETDRILKDGAIVGLVCKNGPRGAKDLLTATFLLDTRAKPKPRPRRSSYGIEVIGEVKRNGPIASASRPELIRTVGTGTSVEPLMIATTVQEGSTLYPSRKRQRKEEEARKAFYNELSETNPGGEMSDKVRSLINTLGNALQCAICLELLYKPVILYPCAHRFCAGCMSTLLGPLDNPNERPQCPNCRASIKSYMKDLQTREVVDGYVKFFPSELQSEEHRSSLDDQDHISSRQGNGFTPTKRIPRRGRR